MEVTIRRIRDNEHERFLERVLDTAWNDLPHGAREGLTPADVAPNTERIIDLLMEQGQNIILVADSAEHRNIGHVWLGEARDSYTGRMQSYIYDLHVEEPFREHGIGHALLEAAEEASRARGDRTLTLVVAAPNTAALHLYESHGFEAERITLTKNLE